jgi:hypothetical protein
VNISRATWKLTSLLTTENHLSWHYMLENDLSDIQKTYQIFGNKYKRKIESVSEKEIASDPRILCHDEANVSTMH